MSIARLNAALDTQRATCPNCGSAAVEAFCAQCGQAQSELRVSVRRWLAELLDDFSLNARLPLTVWLLFRKPGFLSAEWRDGRRTRYISPLRLYLLASVVFFSVTFFVGLPFAGELDLDVGQLGTGLAASAQDLRNEAVAQRMQGFLTLGAALSVPLLALWMRILRRRSGLLYADHLVGSLHVHAVLLIVLTPAYVLLFFGVPGYVVAAALAMYGLVYWVVAWWRSYRPQKGLIRSVWSLSVSTAGWGVLGLAILIGEMALFMGLQQSNNVRVTEYARTSYLVARGAFQRGNLRRARSAGEEGLRFFATFDTTELDDHEPFHLAELHRWVGEADSARARALVLLEEDPEDLLALGLAGVSAQELADSAGAREYFVRFLDLVDTGVEFDQGRDGHGTTFQRYGYSARTWLGRATPDDVRETAFRAYQVAHWTFEDGDSLRSRTLARKALEAFGHVDSTALGEHDRFHVGQLLILDHRWESARAEAEVLLAQDTADVLALGLAGTSADATGDTASARSFFDRLLEVTEAGGQPRDGHEVTLRGYLNFARARAPN